MKSSMQASRGKSLYPARRGAVCSPKNRRADDGRSLFDDRQNRTEQSAPNADRRSFRRFFRRGRRRNPKTPVVSGEFRFQTLLDAIVSSFSDARLEISCIYDNIQKKVRVFPRKVSDYSSLVDLSQDYGVHMTTKLGGVSTYNHIIALGRGELTEREVVHLYRLENGTITETSPGNLGLADRVTTFDYPNAESRDELVKAQRSSSKYLLRCAQSRWIRQKWACPSNSVISSQGGIA